MNMDFYIKKMIEEYPYELDGKAALPANHNLFKAMESKKLNTNDAKVFHTFVAKALYACKRARPDILPTVSYLCSRVKEPTAVDKAKLHRMMIYLRDHQHDNLRLEASNMIVTSADAAFAVHEDYKSHSGITVLLGKGLLHNESSK